MPLASSAVRRIGWSPGPVCSIERPLDVLQQLVGTVEPCVEISQDPGAPSAVRRVS
jgi:hypothetical protein